MTTPAQPVTTQPQSDNGLVIAVAGVLVSAITVEAALLPIQDLFLAAGIPRAAIRGALDAVLSYPPDRQGFHGNATATVVRLNLMRRAQFVVSASRRIADSLRQARARGNGLAAALADAIGRERRYYGQHLEANWNRMNAAAKVDSAAGDYGDMLGWNTVLDSHTSAECKAANRHNFLASSMPLIGYPGMVHPHCRCWPGRPFPGAALLPSGRSAFRRRLVAA